MVDKITKFFRKIEKFFKNIGSGVKLINRGIKQQAVATGQAFYDIHLDQGYILLYTAEFLYTNLVCFFYFLGKSFSLDCAVWYVVRLFFCILYGLTFGIVFIVIQFITGIDLEKPMWDNIYYLETTIGFRISDFPNVILKKCFNCRRLKITEFINTWKYFLLAGDNGKPSDIQSIIMDSVKGFITMGRGFDQLIKAF